MRNWQENQVWTCVPFFSRSLLSLERCNITCSILFWQWGTLINLNQTLIILSTNFYHLFWEIGLNVWVLKKLLSPTNFCSRQWLVSDLQKQSKLKRQAWTKQALSKLTFCKQHYTLHRQKIMKIWKYLSKNG